MNADQQQSTESQPTATEQPSVEDLMAQIAALQAENEQLKTKKSSSKREELYTPYRATKDLNEIRKAAGLKEVNSPMLYIYARKGAFDIEIAQDGTGRKVIKDKVQFIEWAQKHTAAQLVK